MNHIKALDLNCINDVFYLKFMGLEKGHINQEDIAPTRVRTVCTP